ncbi:MAG TPA: thiolase family protein [Pseudonocardia sp.]|jgi:acetyl-CoA C-acetyltransferase
MRNQVAVIGAGMTVFGEHFDSGLEQLAAQAYRAALASVDNGIDPAELEVGFFANVMGSLAGNEIPSGATLANAIGLPGLPVSRVENGCPSGSDAIRIAAMAIASGVYDVAVVVGSEKLRERPTKESLLESGRAGHPILSYANTAATIFAPQAMRHMYEFGTTREQLAMVAVKAAANASLNPNAQRRATITVEDVLNSAPVCTPFTVLDCCPQSDGAAAVVLCRADIAHRFTDKPVYLAGVGLATEALYYHEKTRMTGWDSTRLAARRAFEMAGIGARDIDVVELHDCFTGTEIISYEDLGLCEEGHGGKLVESGATALTGRIPVNPSGGLLAKGHPIGATGVAQYMELFGQLREEAGDRQVALRSGIAVQHNVGGYSVGISVVSVLSRERGGRADG